MVPWIAIITNGIIDFLFKYGTIDTETFVSVFDQFLGELQALEDRPQRIHLKWDNTPHCTNHTFRFLKEYFRNSVIALDYSNITCSSVDHTLFSSELNNFDYFIVGCIERFSVPNNSTTLDMFKGAVCATYASSILDTV